MNSTLGEGRDYKWSFVSLAQIEMQGPVACDMANFNFFNMFKRKSQYCYGSWNSVLLKTELEFKLSMKSED